MCKIKRYIFIAGLLFILFNISGCSLGTLKNIVILNKEKIGCDYTVIEDKKTSSNNSHGYVKNYSSTLEDNVCTTKFDFMNSTGYMKFNIMPRDTLIVNSNYESGDIWVKITQGNLSESEIQKIHLSSKQNTTVDLKQWKTGEINVWIVAQNAKYGVIKIKHDSTDLDWMKIKKYDAIIIKNKCTNQQVAIDDTKFLERFNINDILGLNFTENKSDGNFYYGKAQNYIYTFIKNNKKYEMEAITDDIIKIDDKYYQCYDSQFLGDAFVPPAKYQKADNVLSKIYYSTIGFYKYYNFGDDKGNLAVQYITREHRINKLKLKSELPVLKRYDKRSVIFYWHGEKIQMNVYKGINKEYIEIINNNKILLYEQNHTEYSILDYFDE